MSKGLIAQAAVDINAPVTAVWNALVDPAMIKQFMFGTDVETDWAVGSPIVWDGVWKGQPYKDKGVILAVEPNKLLQHTHFSGMSGQPDVPENYHTLTYELSEEGNVTKLSLSQDGNANEDEQKHSQEMWGAMLEQIKKLLEKN